MEGSQDQIFFKDRESRFLRINETLARRFGLRSPVEAIGKTDADFFPREFAQQKLADEQKVLATGGSVLMREEFDGEREGEQRWISTSKMPLHDRSGAIIGTFGMSHDITAIKRANEHQLAISVGLQKILEITEELNAAEDEDTVYRLAVERAREKLELERCAIFVEEGGRVRGTSGTDMNGRTTDERAHTFPLEGVWIERLRLREPGEKRWSISEEPYHAWHANSMAEAGKGAVAVTMIQSARDQVIGVFCNDNAISRKKLDQARQEIVAVYCTLIGNIVARKRAERERSIASEQQRTAMERTDRLNAVGMLAAGMAHEINNPLQGMLSHLRALQPFVPADSSGNRNLEMVQKGIDTISSLVRRLLMLGSTDEQSRAGADVQESIDFVAQLLESQFRRTNVRIERGVAIQGLNIAMPRAEFVQILMNLFINARDAMPSGGVVSIQTDARDGVAHVRVSDTGQGIPPELIGRIFAPFFTTKGSRGTGLGLSVTESLVRACKGSIAVDSKPGTGTTFHVTLPLLRERSS
jgi:PAS domain S-box-containing protein